MKQLRATIWLVIMAGLAVAATGCDTMRDETFTGRLWNDSVVEHYQPAPRPEVKMYQQRGGPDTLVLYLEQREKTGATKPRAYYALANDQRVQELKKPRFVSLKSAKGLQEIPVELPGRINLSAPVWAELTPDENGFRLFQNGVATDWYHFPVYLDKRNEAERVLLTPVTFTADAAVVGAVVGVVGLYVYAGAACGYHDDHECFAWNGRH